MKKDSTKDLSRYSQSLFKEWKCTRKQRLIALEKRRRWLEKIIDERDPRYESKRNWFLQEWEALDWALPLLWEIVYPPEPWPGLDKYLEEQKESEK